MQIPNAFSIVLLVIFVTKFCNCGKRKAGANEEAKLLKKIRRLAKEAGHEDPRNIGKDRQNSSGICYSKTCLESAIQILEAINFKANPCNETGFADFSCHRRLHRNPPQSKFGNMSLLSWAVNVKNKNLTRDILEKPIKCKKRESCRALRNAKISFKQCKKESDLIKIATKQLWELSKKFGGWPIFTNAEITEFKWEDMAAFLAKLSPKTILFDISFVAATTELEISLDKGYIGSSRKQTRKKMEMIVNATIEHWNETGANFKPPESFEYGITQTLATIDKLQAATWSFRIITRMTIKELGDFTQQRVNWLTFFRTVFKATNAKIHSNTTVHVNKNYVETLTKIWHSAGTWEASLLQYEMFVYLLQHTSVPFPSNYTPTLYLEDSKLTFQMMESACIKDTELKFGAALTKRFQEIGPYLPNIQADIDRLTKNVLSGLQEYVTNSSILYTNGRDKMLKKYKATKRILGYPDWIFDREKFTAYYSNLESLHDDDNEYFSNSIKKQIWKTGMIREGAKGSSHNDFNYWDMRDIIMGSDPEGTTYLPVSNEIKIPPTLATSPLYNIEAPGYLNYGGLGAIVGHGLAHGMDSTGIFYDSDGYHRKSDFLGDGDLALYNKWVKSVKMDYNNSKNHQHGEPVSNATEMRYLINFSTFREEVADIIGLQAAFNAYKIYLRENGNQDIKLPGLDHIKDEQLFFVAYSNMRCAEMTYPETRQKTLFGTSNFGYTRATVPLRRSKQFAKTFNCTRSYTEFEI